MSERRLPGVEVWLVVALIATLSWYHHTILLSHFYGEVYGFHDLGVINDWFSNALYTGRPFWITDIGANHLRTHLTPTLFLLIPLYAFARTQYMVLLLGVAAVTAGLLLLHRFWSRLAHNGGFSGWPVTAASAVLVVVFGMNLYTRTVLQSAHLEVLYLPLALAFFYSVVFTRSWILQGALLALALGVREDAGVYLSCQTLALLWLPGPHRELPGWRWRVGLFSALALLYVVVIVKVVWPLLFVRVANHIQRGWSDWGTTWPTVVASMLASPVRVGQAIAASAAADLNRGFLFLSWVNPAVGLVVNLPGVLLYTASAVDKNQLWFYNASFLLPGFVLGMVAGAYRLSELLRWAGRRGGWPRPVLIASLAALFAWGLAGVWSARHATADQPLGYTPRPTTRGQTAAALLARWTSTCGPLAKIATDFHHIVLVPLRAERYLLWHYQSADVVVLFRGADQRISGFGSTDELWDRLARGPEFVLRESTEEHRVFTRPGSCGEHQAAAGR